MNISWVFADNIVLDPMADLKRMKDLGPSWGSWKTWRACSTDNVICHDVVKTEELIKREFYKTCNFFIPNSSWTMLDQPDGVKVYEGKFVDDSLQPDEIVAMHLAASTSDIILLLGFDWTEKPKNPDKLAEHYVQAHRAMYSSAIRNNPQVQWVLVDHPGPIMKKLEHLENLSQDTMETALGLLND